MSKPQPQQRVAAQNWLLVAARLALTIFPFVLRVDAEYAATDGQVRRRS